MAGYASVALCRIWCSWVLPSIEAPSSFQDLSTGKAYCFRRNPPLESLLAAWQPLQLGTSRMAGDEEDDFAHDDETPTETSAGSASIGCDPYQRFLRWVSSIGLVIVRQT